MSPRPRAQLIFLHEVDVLKMFKYAKNQLCSRVGRGVLKAISVRKITEIAKNQLNRICLEALKIMRTRINVGNSCCSGQLNVLHCL